MQSKAGFLSNNLGVSLAASTAASGRSPLGSLFARCALRTHGYAVARRAAHAVSFAILCLLATGTDLLAQNSKPSGTLITNVTAHIGNGTSIANAAIAINAEGKIDFVAPMTDPRVNPAKFAELVNALGQHAYPGFIATNTQLGLVEVEAVRATLDFNEVGTYNPHIRAAIAYNTDSDIIPTLRSNGVLMAQIAPTGGIIMGKSAVVGLGSEPQNWEEAVYRMETGIHLSWPRRFQYSGWWAEPGDTKKSDKYNEGVDAIRQYFQAARAYSQQEKTSPKNLAFEAMRPVLNREQKVFIHVDDMQSILEAVSFGEAEKLDIVIVGGRDAWRVAEFLALRQVPVILQQVQSLPSKDDEDYDQPYKSASILAEKGVLFCLSMDGSWQQRNLMFQAGQAVAFGLDSEKAVAAITLNAARILGIDKTTGSLEAGKDATLILSAGDVLDIRTSIVGKAYLKGKEQNLSDKQKVLFQQYLDKFKLGR